ncbi:MAG: hypothetical protein RMM53_04280 [Bacteroidia bacterium]|nr:hypothetical protein [Bacteroidia bacterium]MDW8333415.1 hypothetical protein [Bacteroidia bacterium]
MKRVVAWITGIRNTLNGDYAFDLRTAENGENTTLVYASQRLIERMFGIDNLESLQNFLLGNIVHVVYEERIANLTGYYDREGLFTLHRTSSNAIIPDPTLFQEPDFQNPEFRVLSALKITENVKQHMEKQQILQNAENMIRNLLAKTDNPVYREALIDALSWVNPDTYLNVPLVKEDQD